MPDGEKMPAAERLASFRRDVARHDGRNMRWRRASFVSFCAFVIVPTLAGFLYFFYFASRQYSTEFRFGVRAAEMVQVETSSLLQGIGLASQSSIDSYAVAQYILSGEVVSRLEERLPLRTWFGAGEIDLLSRLSTPVTKEDMLDYWKKQVDASYEASTGTIVVRVRAFSAEQSAAIAREVLDLSERLVNDLSLRSRRDTVKFAEEQLSRAETRLKTARADMVSFRDKEGLIDPRRLAEASTLLLARLKEELTQARADMRTTGSYLRADSPTMRHFKTRIESLEAEIAVHQRTIADGSIDSRKDVLSRVIGAYEGVAIEQQFAERFYVFSLEALQRVQAAADRKALYLAIFVPPSTPETAEHPRRLRASLTVFAIGFIAWAIVSLTIAAARDHL